jgi:predicted nucleic acid-binding protein
VSVIDASVAVKWFIDEKDSNLALELLESGQGDLHVPDEFVVEVAGSLVRRANEDKAAREQWRAGLFHLIDLIDRGAIAIVRMPTDQIIDAANLAIDLGHPLRDCIYLDLAMKLGRPLITADARFAAKARNIWPDTRGLVEGWNGTPSAQDD